MQSVLAELVQGKRSKGLLESIAETAPAPSLEGMYADYEGEISKFWFVDDHPDYLQFQDQRRVPPNQKTGHWSTSGWVSYRGRLIPYPRTYKGLQKTDELRKEQKALNKAVWDNKYTCLFGNCFIDHPNKKYAKGQLLRVYVKTSVWKSMTDEERWNYLRDLDVNGYKTPWETRKKYEDYHWKKMNEELEQWIAKQKAEHAPRNYLVEDREFWPEMLIKDLTPYQFEENLPDIEYGHNSLIRKVQNMGII